MTGGHRSSAVRVLGSRMQYREAGEPRGPGAAVLLLHGNPTSSYLWRHVLDSPAAATSGCRWIAPDLIGMGASGRPAIGYRLADHLAYVDAFIDALGLSELVLVGHDWGVAIALDLLRRRPRLIRGVAMMEGHLRPLRGWEDFDEGGRELFRRLRTPSVGEQMVLHDNFFLDTLLPAAMHRPLTTEALTAYRGPYPDPQSRRPLLQWAREIPIGGQPPDVAQRMGAAAEHLISSPVATLLVHGEPGVLIGPAQIRWCRDHLRSLTVVDVGGPAGHFLPEDRPAQVAQALTAWIGHLAPRPGTR